jgi:hypothetical protein
LYPPAPPFPSLLYDGLVRLSDANLSSVIDKRLGIYDVGSRHAAVISQLHEEQ